MNGFDHHPNCSPGMSLFRWWTFPIGQWYEDCDIFLTSDSQMIWSDSPRKQHLHLCFDMLHDVGGKRRKCRKRKILEEWVVVETGAKKSGTTIRLLIFSFPFRFCPAQQTSPNYTGLHFVFINRLEREQHQSDALRICKTKSVGSMNASSSGWQAATVYFRPASHLSWLSWLSSTIFSFVTVRLDYEKGKWWPATLIG